MHKDIAVYFDNAMKKFIVNNTTDKQLTSFKALLIIVKLASLVFVNLLIMKISK